MVYAEIKAIGSTPMVLSTANNAVSAAKRILVSFVYYIQENNI